MPTKRLILIHGRSIKPAKSSMEKLAKEAIEEGLKRSSNAAATSDFANDKIKFDLVYFGDLTNEILLDDNKKKYEALLTENDPVTGAKVFPISELRSAFEQTRLINKFTKSAYQKVLDNADDYRFLDEAADIASFFGSLLTFGLLNQFLIGKTLPDITAYFSQDYGSKMRLRLRTVLEPAIEAGEDICIVAHSMGAIITYDLLWNMSHRSEYQSLQDLGNKVNKFVTIGCPLGEPGVKRNLQDGNPFNNQKYPKNIIEDWLNYHAEDDYVARDEKMKSSFRKMLQRGLINSIKDKKVYNCWVYHDAKRNSDVSNPHDLYGYLMNQEVGKGIGDWIAN